MIEIITIVRCAHVILAGSLTLTWSISHNVISITAWRCHDRFVTQRGAVSSAGYVTVIHLSWLTTQTGASAQFTRVCVSHMTPVDAGTTKMCDSSDWLKVILLTCWYTRHLSSVCCPWDLSRCPWGDHKSSIHLTLLTVSDLTQLASEVQQEENLRHVAPPKNLSVKKAVK